MFRNYFIINIILVIVISFLSVKLIGALVYTIDIPTEAAQKKVEKESNAGGKSRINKTARLRSSFDPISKMDLFRPSRSASKALRKISGKVSIKNPPRLFGTVIMNNEKTAILENPSTKTTKIYRINDSVAGFVVSEILEDRVVLLRDGSKIEVRLRDEKKGISSKVKTPAKRKPPRRLNNQKTDRRTRSATSRNRADKRTIPRNRNTGAGIEFRPEFPDKWDQGMDLMGR